jgi:hypothetical protein
MVEPWLGESLMLRIFCEKMGHQVDGLQKIEQNVQRL